MKIPTPERLAEWRRKLDEEHQWSERDCRDVLAALKEAQEIALKRVTPKLLREWKEIEDLTRECAILQRRVEALEKAGQAIVAVFHPKGPGYGTCSVCTLAGGQHSDSCCIGMIVTALRGGEVS